MAAIHPTGATVNRTSEAQAFLKRYQLRTKKRLGQNFLIDGNVLDEIATTALRRGANGIIEIGPGPGTLTRRLAGPGRPLVAVEKDETLVDLLRHDFEDLGNVQIVHGDALDGPLAARMTDIDRPAVVGNIPYNISSALLLTLVEQRFELGPVCLLMQKEVVDRLLASPGSKAYGRLSILLQNHADPDSGIEVAPESFWPAPKVRSQVITWRWRSAPRVATNPDLLDRVVRAAFGQRRKTLRNALRATFHPTDVQDASRHLDLSRRAEQLSLEEFAELAAALSQSGS